MPRAKPIAALAVIVAACGCTGRPAAVQSIPLSVEVTRSPWNSSYSTGEVLTSRHYRIYTTTTNQVLLGHLPGFIEAAYQNYLSLTGLGDRASDGPMSVYMMATRQEWLALSENVLHAHRGIYQSVEAGGYCYNGVCAYWDLSGPSTFTVAAHEGFHQFLYHRLKDKLPTWLEEGLAVAAEGHDIQADCVTFDPNRNPFRINNLRSVIIEDRWIPIAQLLPLEAADVFGRVPNRAVNYYAQLWALSTFLHSDPTYSVGLRRMLADAEAGNFGRALNLPPESLGRLRLGRDYNQTVCLPLFNHYISRDLQAFDRQYLAFARQLAGLGSPQGAH